MIFLHEPSLTYLIYAHLGRDIALKVGQMVKAGRTFATVGHPTQNGGWYPHVHVQAVADDAYLMMERNQLRDLDGYGFPRRAAALAMDFPDPLPYVRLAK